MDDSRSPRRLIRAKLLRETNLSEAGIAEMESIIYQTKSTRPGRALSRNLQRRHPRAGHKLETKHAQPTHREFLSDVFVR